MFTTPVEHLEAELKRLDLLLHREILRLRARYELSLDEFRGLYVSDEQVDHLVAEGQESDNVDADSLSDRAASARRRNVERLDEKLPWRRLVTAFGLSPFEEDVLLLALAPEVDLKYETIFAYLNNDVSRKRPTFDLALRLFADDRVAPRRLLLSEGALFGSGLVRAIDLPGQSWLATSFESAPSVIRFVFGLRVWDARLDRFVRQTAPAATWRDLVVSDDVAASLQRVAERLAGGVRTARDSTATRADAPEREVYDLPPILVFQGAKGTDTLEAASALCRALGRSLLRVDAEPLLSDDDLSGSIRALSLQQRLAPAGIYVEGLEALFNKDGGPVPEARRVVEQLSRLRVPVILSFPPHTYWGALLAGVRLLSFEFGSPDFEQRRRLWNRCLADHGCAVPESLRDAVAERFVLNPGQIRRAVAAALDTRQSSGNGALTPDDIFEAARAESGQQLERLARKVKLVHSWDDLILPENTLRRVREIAAAVRHRHLVYSQWGFERRIAAGKGLKVLFTGTPGTGKTMTAGVIARDLGQDLYKIDLSGVVSKYIGETEKNLDRIFRAAHASNAILFFDEADALFGKRSEVKDAHDRYANIETSYLLQKMEEYEGAVILATNLRKNIDEAFSRRMHHVIEFPMPDEDHRERLWREMFPSRVPLDDDIDFRFLARQFTLSGGDIQNVALDAAFLAAEDGHRVTMKQLVNAVARQLTKQGRLPSATDFRQYHSLITSDV